MHVLDKLLPGQWLIAQGLTITTRALLAKSLSDFETAHHVTPDVLMISRRNAHDVVKLGAHELPKEEEWADKIVLPLDPLSVFGCKAFVTILMDKGAYWVATRKDDETITE
jgi:hypothetical protein